MREIASKTAPARRRTVPPLLKMLDKGEISERERDAVKRLVHDYNERCEVEHRVTNATFVTKELGCRVSKSRSAHIPIKRLDTEDFRFDLVLRYVDRKCGDWMIPFFLRWCKGEDNPENYVKSLNADEYMHPDSVRRRLPAFCGAVADGYELPLPDLSAMREWVALKSSLGFKYVSV